MIPQERIRLRRWLAIAFVLLASLCALAIAYYVDQARRHVGADYTAMVTDVVRAQEDAVQLRLTLDSLADRAEGLHLRQLGALLGRIAQRLPGMRHLLHQSDLPPADYAPLLDELDIVEGRLPGLAHALAAAQAGDGGAPSVLVARGQDIEESLAWAYSELNEVLHAASAEQRRMMQRLSVAVIVLVVVVLLGIGGLMLALLRIHEQREALRHQSQTDALTGLYNRRKIYEVAAHELARRHRSGGTLALVLIDLDHFKYFNDTYGHPVGDAVLKAFAGVLLDEVREVDYPVRMSGEEFAVLMPDSDRAAAYQLAERIRRATEALELPGRGCGASLTASFGVTAAGAYTDHFDQLFSRADRLLYRAKAGGRNRTEVG